MKTSQSFCLALFALVFLFSRSSRADERLCARAYIQGLQHEHERGAYFLGPATTADPRKMSVYITIGTYHGKKALYIQTNYKPAAYDFPLKAAVSEDLSVRSVLYWIAGKGLSMNFDASHLTYYVEPAFFKDSTYGKYKNQLTGKVVRLRDSRP